MLTRNDLHVNSLLFFDFETYSKVNLKVSGSQRYARDESTGAICLSYSNDDIIKTISPFVGGYEKFLEDIREVFNSDKIKVAFNLPFDFFILRKFIPAIKADTFIDAMDILNAVNQSGSLDEISKRLFGGAGKYESGRAAMLKLSRKWCMEVLKTKRKKLKIQRKIRKDDQVL